MKTSLESFYVCQACTKYIFNLVHTYQNTIFKAFFADYGEVTSFK